MDPGPVPGSTKGASDVGKSLDVRIDRLLVGPIVSMMLALGIWVDGASADERDGRTIVERECAACHRLGPPAAATFERLLDRTAPDLFYAGTKFRREWLVDWLQDPMPIRYSGVVYLNHLGFEGGKDQIAIDTVQSCSAKLDRERAEAVTEYLMTLEDASMKTGVIEPGKKFSKPKALRLFRKQLPCIGCHTVQWGKRIMGGVSGPNLADAGNRLNPDWVYARIENPQHWDPKTWMPRVEMSHKKRELLTRFISSMKSPARLDLEKPDAVVQGPAVPMSAFVTREAASGSDPEKNYRLYCVQCHGSRGNGRGINDTVGGLSVSPKNHVYAEEMVQLSDEELGMAIAEGGDAVQKSGLMPPWGQTLSAQEINDLVLYLRQLCQCKAGG